MRDHLWKSISIFVGGLVLAAALSAASPASAQLIGPKTAAELGIAVADSNPGSSQEMGFAGGKIIAYSSIDTTGFTGYQWGLAGTGVRLSLDGDFNGAAGETLTFNGALSELTQGVAIWSGNSFIVNRTAADTTVVVEVETRFRMTVTSNGGGSPVPLIVLGPRVDILGESLTEFQVRFETLAESDTLSYLMCVPGTDAQFPSFGPMLEVFDCATDISQDEQAYTAVLTGFFTEQTEPPDPSVDLAEVLDALSVAEAKLDGINVSGLNFITEDWAPRWLGMSTQTTLINNNQAGIQAIESKLDSLQVAVGSLPQDIQNLLPNVEGVLTTEQLAYLLGLPVPKPADFPDFDWVRTNSVLYQLLDAIDGGIDALEAKADAIEGKIDDVAADLGDQLDTAEIDIEVVQSQRLSGFEKVFAVLLTENGKPVDAELLSVFAVSEARGEMVSVELDWLLTPIQTGLAELRGELPEHMDSTKIFLIRLNRAEIAGGCFV